MRGLAQLVRRTGARPEERVRPQTTAQPEPAPRACCVHSWGGLMPPAGPIYAPLTLVLGKGGVGRSTVSRTLTAAARVSGLDARYAELAPRTGLHAPAVHAPSGGRLGDRPLHIAPEEALEDAATPVFGSRMLARAALGNFAVKRLLEVLPGIHEYALLLSAIDLIESGRAGCDQLIIDMPATGHGLSWLGAAERFARLVPKGRSREQADRLDATLRDPHETALVVVCVPEPLVLRETLALRGELRTQLARDADLLVINRVPEVPSGAAEAAERLAAEAGPLAGPAARLGRWLAARAEARTIAMAAAAGIPHMLLAEGSAHVPHSPGDRHFTPIAWRDAS